jgi:3-hydroxy-3-methylglutaryl CoA synthase
MCYIGAQVTGRHHDSRLDRRGAKSIADYEARFDEASPADTKASFESHCHEQGLYVNTRLTQDPWRTPETNRRKRQEI